jgi:7-cyano-7-deazaguanine synthase
VGYGQRHVVEVAAARRVAGALGAVEHKVLVLDLRAFGGSALTADLPIPKHRSGAEIGRGVPATYVPARNTILLSLALAWAEVLGAWDLFLGVNALDYSGYPDCRPEYIEAFQTLANLATKAGVEGRRTFMVHTPLIRMSKREIIRTGRELGVDFGMTMSCYDPDDTGAACGACDACQLRLRGFAELGIPDPAPYRSATARR